MAAAGNPPCGPFTAAQITEAVKVNRFEATILCWREGMPQWLPLAQVEPFAGVIGRARPSEHGAWTVPLPSSLGAPGFVTRPLSTNTNTNLSAATLWWWAGGGAIALLLLVGLAWLLLQGVGNHGKHKANTGHFDYYLRDCSKFVAHIDFAKERNSEFHKNLTASGTARLQQSLFSVRCWLLSSFPDWKCVLNSAFREDDVDEVFMFSENGSRGVLVVRANGQTPMAGWRPSRRGCRHPPAQFRPTR